METNMTKTVVTLVVLIVLVLAGAMYYRSQRSIDESAPSSDDDESVFCTMDAKQCPDGSYVGRTGPDCEFAPCPGVPITTMPAPEDGVICAADAYQCPDGSWVGRSGSDCRFNCAQSL